MRYGNNISTESEKPKASDDGESNVDVHNENNNIYFYTDVNKQSILELNKNIKSVSCEMKRIAEQLSIPCPPVILHINSPGGSLLDAFAAVDYIDRNNVPIRSIVEGMAASAATLLSVSASERYIQAHSYMLIHQLSSFSMGKYEEMKDDMENNHSLMKRIQDIYLENTKIPSKVLKELLKRDLLLDAEQCLKYGLVDAILDN